LRLFSLSPREARAGREPERGVVKKGIPPPPTLSSLLRREEREKRTGGNGVKLNRPHPNTAGIVGLASLLAVPEFTQKDFDSLGVQNVAAYARWGARDGFAWTRNPQGCQKLAGGRAPATPPEPRPHGDSHPGGVPELVAHHCPRGRPPSHTAGTLSGCGRLLCPVTGGVVAVLLNPRLSSASPSDSNALPLAFSIRP
jgi:hypothetical protein